MKTEYTREELIKLCDEGQVDYSKWCDRDSFSAQRQLHIAKLTLLGGCKFRIITNRKEGSLWEKRKIESSCVTDEETIWVEIFYDEWEDGEDWQNHFIPTPKKLKEVNRGDWY
jgi:hypothetical protein